MLKAIKANKVIRITDKEQKTYRNLGYDIYKDDKKVANGVGKTVPYSKYEKVLKELEELKKQASKKKTTNKSK